MSKKYQQKNISKKSVTDNIKNYILSFLSKQEKLEDIIKSWQSKSNQFNLIEMIKRTMEEKSKGKDPNAPKRPRTAYIFFCNDKRPKVREANPNMRMTEVTNELGKMWKNLKESKRQKYLEQAQKDRERYTSEMNQYKPKGPKKALTAYFFFCMEKRHEVKKANPEMKVTDISKELGRMWKEDFSDDISRKKWIDASEKDKQRYEEEKLLTKGGKNLPEKKDTGNILPEKKDTGKILPENEKPKNKQSGSIQVSGMILFMYKSRPEIEADYPEWDTKQVIAEMKRRWSALSPNERAEYDE